jgi:alanyl-tRNA synthetase
MSAENTGPEGTEPETTTTDDAVTEVADDTTASTEGPTLEELQAQIEAANRENRKLKRQLKTTTEKDSPDKAKELEEREQKLRSRELKVVGRDFNFVDPDAAAFYLAEVDVMDEDAVQDAIDDLRETKPDIFKQENKTVKLKATNTGKKEEPKTSGDFASTLEGLLKGVRK